MGLFVFDRGHIRCCMHAKEPCLGIISRPGDWDEVVAKRGALAFDGVNKHSESLISSGQLSVNLPRPAGAETLYAKTGAPTAGEFSENDQQRLKSTCS